MTRVNKPARETARTFSPRAQRVANRAVSTDRSGSARPLGALALGESAVRARSLLALFAAGLIAALPAHAFAQEANDAADSVSVRDRPREEYDPLGVRLGGFTLHGSVGLTATHNSNVFATETNEQDDLIYSLTPRARLQSNWSRHALMFEGGASVDRYSDLDEEDAETYFAGAIGRVDIGSNTSISGIARYAHEVESRTNPDALTVNEPVEYDRTELAVSAQHTFSRVRLRGTFANVMYDYDDAGLVDQDFRDSEENRFTGRAEVELTPRIGWVLEASTDERDYDNAPGLNSEGMTYLTGINVNLTDLMRGEITVGQFERDYDFGGSVEGTAIAGNLEWYITRLTTITLNASQSGEETGAVVALPYTSTSYGARVDHELMRNVILTAGVSAGDRDYEVIDRSDEFFTGDVGVEYLMNRRVALNLRYRHEELESNGVNRYRDFDQDVISAGVSLRL